MKKTMIISILVNTVLLFNQVLVANGENVNVSCPILSRTRHKELRTFMYKNCTSGFKTCFQQIMLTEIVRNEQHAFLFASGCASKEILKPFNLTEETFMKLCDKKKVGRCVHTYQHRVYYGTLCCERNSEKMFGSWLWDVFFGSSEELNAEMENTVSFVQRESIGMHDDHDNKGALALYIAGPFIVTFIFTLLSLLQYYHVNDGILS
ncbi:uncharacterized protein CELE_C55A6.11 [Caenorhabditis elegans]|uniref:Uncharacterized protein n=1 Tax=Caenorhabditis elegans TaxID=6239 RepID=Q7YX68_CAEEL|nr:Uncharacterized protein CELE_C55A6.11 [Caenorhabditis elegans]CAE17730.1 Uncharacterized protein CELE_C55A6.11 [Caenorhabditis elegans]|eukprot:NP_001023741.1 Uncharacterized protein CELE_C55A6.11 [Caenorhabditis elegans]